MSDLRLAINIVEILVGIIVCMVLGDYVGYKVGRMRLATSGLFVFLGLVIIFAIYAAVRLT